MIKEYKGLSFYVSVGVETIWISCIDCESDNDMRYSGYSVNEAVKLHYEKVKEQAQ